ncbi:hypothetical protein, partial [Bartonella massiliensis]|uniref:hypothetical protein n=1 Tax=Bartonella massiliensis TaxID=929795 RepID=UPI001AEE4FC5
RNAGLVRVCGFFYVFLPQIILGGSFGVLSTLFSLSRHIETGCEGNDAAMGNSLKAAICPASNLLTKYDRGKK